VRGSGLDLALSLTVDGVAPPDTLALAWGALMRSRSLVLDEMAARHRAVVASRDTAVARAAGVWLERRQAFAHLLARGLGDDTPEAYRAAIERARAASEEAERALARSSRAFRSGQALARTGLDEVRAALAPGEALVAYTRYRRRTAAPPGTAPAYAALVLRAGAGPRGVALGSAASIDSLVQRWRELASRRLPERVGRELLEKQCRSAGEAVRQRIWDPVATEVEDARRIYVVPDAALHLVNFDALPVGRAEFLIERPAVIHLLTAERDLVPGARSEVLGQGLLAMGDPDFDAAPAAASAAAGHGESQATGGAAPPAVFRGDLSRCGDFGALRWSRLPASAQEVEDVVATWRGRADSRGATGSGTNALTGAGATEAAFKRLAPGRRVIHLATHGFCVAGSCGSLLEGDARTSRGRLGAAPGAGENPLLLSGLALAAANRRGAATPGEEDGVVTAEEVSALDLNGVEWAVLSACETGVGEVRAGEGVFGLRRAFQVAGAGALIMSLWPVDDAATRAWMKHLYEARLERHLSAADAVREASLAALRERRASGASTHPFTWGAFVAAGAER